jgi:hypothetical protein
LPDRSQQGKELPFPARLYIRVNPHSQSDAVHPSADLPSAETAHHSEAANVANVRYIHAVEGKVFKIHPIVVVGMARQSILASKGAGSDFY